MLDHFLRQKFFQSLVSSQPKLQFWFPAPAPQIERRSQAQAFPQLAPASPHGHSAGRPGGRCLFTFAFLPAGRLFLRKGLKGLTKKQFTLLARAIRGPKSAA